MSEKTLGELAQEVYIAKAKHLYKPWKPEIQELCWQAAADAIAAPLLARIAELEVEIVERKFDAERVKARVAELEGDSGCFTPEEKYALYEAEIEQWRDRCQAAERALETDTAYQRGVAEERERAFTAGAIFGWDACENNWQEAEYEARKQDAIRSASPAVDVTSDKGGGR